MLRNINRISIGKDKSIVKLLFFLYNDAYIVQIERNLIFNYFSELEEYRRRAADDASNNPTGRNYLDLLIEHLKKNYIDIINRLDSLLKSGKITYNLFQALFKLNIIIYTTYIGTLKPRCVIFDYNEEKTRKNKIKYYDITCYYLDFDGDIFGEVIIKVAISKFRGVVRIDSLKFFSLYYHPD